MFVNIVALKNVECKTLLQFQVLDGNNLNTKFRDRVHRKETWK